MTASRIIIILLFAVGGVVAAIAVAAQDPQSDDILLIDQPVDHDVYAAHREVNVRTTVNGDLVAAGNRVTVDGDVIGDVIVAAQNIEIRSRVSDDLRAVGQHIRVASPVSGHVVAAGQTVVIEQVVGDWAWLAGDTVEVFGNVGDSLKVSARKITINAEVAGDVELIGDQLDLGPKAVVRGDLRWRSDNEADISPEAQIEGEFIKEPLPDLVDDLRTGSSYSMTLKVIVALILLFLLFARPLRASANRIAANPGVSLVLGLAVFCVAPILAIVLLFTGVGALLGLAVLFTFLAVLMLGVLTGLFAASDMVVRRFLPQPAMWQSLAAIVVTVVAVSLLTKVPWLGTISVMAIWLIGIGALCWNTWDTLRSLETQKLQLS